VSRRLPAEIAALQTPSNGPSQKGCLAYPAVHSELSCDLLLFLGDPLLQQCFIPAVEEPFAKQLQTQSIAFARTERGWALFQSGFVDTKDFPTDQTLTEQRANFWRLQPRHLILYANFLSCERAFARPAHSVSPVILYRGAKCRGVFNLLISKRPETADNLPFSWLTHS
jgi:hypothetical protein